MPSQDPAVDQCKPDPGSSNPSKFCEQHPTFPQCQTPTTPPTDNCQPPVFGGCPTTPPPDSPPSGNTGRKGGGKGGGNGGNQVQRQAARPIDE